MSMERIEEGVRSARENVQRWFSTRQTRGTLSKVHAWDHVYAVARHGRVVAEEIARRQGLNAGEAKEVGALAEAAGYLHDISRRNTELELHGPFGSKTIKKLVARYGFLKPFSREEIEDIMACVAVHEVDWNSFYEKTEGFTSRGKIIAQALVIGDKLFEASGHRVLERRAFFVGRERLEKDLKHLTGKYGSKAPLYAVAMESCRRLRVVNALQDYPEWAKPVAQPLHAVQEKYYYGLLKHLGLTEEQLLDEMKSAKFPCFDKEEEKIRQRVAEANSEAKVKAISDDTARSAAELTMHFALSKTPEEAILSFNPQGKQAKEWLEGIKSYRQASEEYLKTLLQQMRQARY